MGGIPISNSNEVENNETSADGYVYSNSIPFPGSKMTFADKSKRIENKYKRRPDDKLSKDGMKRELDNLTQTQEQLKEAMGMNNDTNKFFGGGILNKPTIEGINNYINNPQAYSTDVPNATFGMFNPNITPMQSKGLPIIAPTSKEQLSVLKGENNITTPDNTYTPNMTVPMAGYAAQALANIPGLFTKAEKVKYGRVTPKTIDLSAQRTSAMGDRNLALNLARKNASIAGQSGINAATSDIMGKYGDVYNQSIMNEQNANAQILNRGEEVNLQTSTSETEANAREKDAARMARQQSLLNMGQVAATAGKMYQDIGNDANMINVLNSQGGDYRYIFKDGKIQAIKRYRPAKKRMGGKI